MPEPTPDDEPREDAHKPVVPTPVVVTDDIAAALVERFPGSIFVESHEQPVVYVDRAHWHDVALHLRDDEQCTMCLDVTVVDYLTAVERAVPPGVEPERFEVVANFLAHPRKRRIRTICQVPDSDLQVASITDVYPGTDFPEREAYDMYGVAFTDHPDLTRILMPDDWVGYPLRKDDAPARVPVTFKEDPRPT